MSSENPMEDNSTLEPLSVDAPTQTPHLVRPDCLPDSLSSSGQDHRVERLLEAIKSQNDDQISLQRSTHALVVDLSSRVRQSTDDASSRAQRSMFLEIVMLHDSLDQVLAWIHNSDPPQSREAVVDRLETLRVELLEILIRREIRPYDEDHPTLDRRLHRAIRALPTPDPGLNDRVERVLRPGFLWRDQVLRPEEVVIFKYKPVMPEKSEEKS